MSFKSNTVSMFGNIGQKIKDQISTGVPGGTFYKNGQIAEFDSGYLFAIGGEKISTHSGAREISESIFKIYLRSVNLRLIGYWINENILYIDSVIHTNDKNFALAAAKIKGEIAIYDCEKKQEIPVE